MIQLSIRELQSSVIPRGRSEWRQSLDTGLGCRTQNVLTGDGFGVIQGDHLILKSRVLRQEQCQVTVLEPGPGQDPAWCHISGGWRPPGTLQGLSLACGEGDSQAKDPSVVPSPRSCLCWAHLQSHPQHFCPQ